MTQLNTHIEREAYSIKEISAKYGLSCSHVRNEIQRGALHARRSGKRVLILATDIADYLRGDKSVA